LILQRDRNAELVSLNADDERTHLLQVL
jgi:hypothetical protein